MTRAKSRPETNVELVTPSTLISKPKTRTIKEDEANGPTLWRALYEDHCVVGFVGEGGESGFSTFKAGSMKHKQLVRERGGREVC